MASPLFHLRQVGSDKYGYRVLGGHSMFLISLLLHLSGLDTTMHAHVSLGGLLTPEHFNT